MTDVYFVKNGQLRHATSPRDETELRFDGWREVAAGAVADEDLRDDPTTTALANQAAEAHKASSNEGKTVDEPEKVADEKPAPAKPDVTPKPGPRQS